MAKFFNTQEADKALENKINNVAGEAFELEMYNVKNGKPSILLADPIMVDINKDFTALGQYATALAPTVYNHVMSQAQADDPILSRVKGEFVDAQKVYFNVRSAQAGLAKGGTFASSVNSSPSTGRTAMSASTGFFGAKVSLGLDELALLRDTSQWGGSYAAEAMRRAVTQVVLKMYQTQRQVITKTLANNEYTYYSNGGTQTNILNYGRLDKNYYNIAANPDRAWQTVTTSTGVVVDNTNPAVNPVDDLIELFTNNQNTIIRNTIPYLKGLALNPETARVITKFAQNGKSPMDAIAYMAAQKGGYGAEQVIKSNVPALANVDLIIYEGMIDTAVDFARGDITKKEYLIPTGKIIPILDYEGVGMGTMLFTPEPRAEWMMNATALPTGALGVSDPRAAYMRVMSSLNDPRAESPYWYVEAGARFAFVNPVAASTSYVINTAIYN